MPLNNMTIEMQLLIVHSIKLNNDLGTLITSRVRYIVTWFGTL